MILWWCASALQFYCSLSFHRWVNSINFGPLYVRRDSDTALSSRDTCPCLAPPLLMWNAVKPIGTYHAILCFVSERSAWFNDCRSACSDRPESIHINGGYLGLNFWLHFLRLNIFIVKAIHLNYQDVHLNYIKSLLFPDVCSNMSSYVIRYT